MSQEHKTAWLLELFEERTVVDITEIRKCLGDVSAMTAFRYLRTIPYRRSYNENGKYYVRHDHRHYDRLGLWRWEDVRFSVDGSLRRTVRRFVYESPGGATHRELQEQLGVRVQNTLLDLLRKVEVDRERVMDVFVYLHVDAEARQRQLDARRELVVSGTASLEGEDYEVSDRAVILVLLTLVRHPGSTPGEVAHRLRGHVPRITHPQVRAVFTRFDLGKKKRPSTF